MIMNFPFWHSFAGQEKPEGRKRPINRPQPLVVDL
jgi:hypothetical protein